MACRRHPAGSFLRPGGLVAPCHSKLPFRIWKCKDFRFHDDCKITRGRLQGRFHDEKKITGGRLQGFPTKPFISRHVLSTRGDHFQLSIEDSPPEPFMLTHIKEAIWGVKSLIAFLVEQPSQLKYIEWPGFQSTLRTAILTLVIVALLIVALSSVDSILCYVLALLLRRSA